MTEMEPYRTWIFTMREKSIREKLERDLGKIFENQNMRKKRFGVIYEADTLQARLKRGEEYSLKGGIYNLICYLETSEGRVGESIRQDIIDYIDGNIMRGVLWEVEGMGYGVLAIEKRKRL